MASAMTRLFLIPEDLDTGPGGRLIQPLTQISGDLLTFIDDLQPDSAPA